MHKKYHEKFKILDILAVTTQAHEGIETKKTIFMMVLHKVTTQAHEGIETLRSAQCQRFRGGIQCLYPAKKYGALTVPFCFQALKR